MTTQIDEIKELLIKTKSNVKHLKYKNSKGGRELKHIAQNHGKTKETMFITEKRSQLGILDAQIISAEDEKAEIEAKRARQNKQIVELKQLIEKDTSRLNKHQTPHQLRENYMKAKQRNEQIKQMIKKDEVSFNNFRAQKWSQIGIQSPQKPV